MLKKSYMNKSNILSENFLKKLRDKIANKLAIISIKKDKKIKNDMKNLNKELEDLWASFNDMASNVDPNHKPHKPKKVTIDDFIG